MNSTLSANGVVRRAQIRAGLMARMDRRARARRGLRVVGGAALLVLATLLWTRGRGAVDGASTASGSPPRLVAAGVLLKIVRDDPTVVQRLNTQPAPPRVVVLDDGELSAQLRSSGRSGAVLRLAGRVQLPGLQVDDWQ